MKSSLKRILLAVVVLALGVMSCGFGNTIKDVATNDTDIYDEAIKMINACEIENANYSLVINGNKAKIDSVVEERIAYIAGVNENTATWTGNFQKISDELDTTLNNAAESPNLAQMAENGTAPGDISKGFGLYINALTQAAPPEVKAEISQSVIDIKAEAFDSMIYAGTKVNDVCGKYNTWHDTTEGEIITAVSEKLGYALPEHISLVTGNSGENTDSFK